MVRLVLLWLLVHLGGRLPAWALYAGADAAGIAAWYALASLRATTRDHMRHVHGPGARSSTIDRDARGCARSAARYYADFARYAHLPPERSFEQIDEIVGAEHVFEAYDRGCGVILASAHLGNPEFISQALGSFFDLLVLTERLEPPALNDWVHRTRAQSGVRYEPVGLGAARASVAHLRAGGVLGVLVDRDVAGSGQPAVFFGERAMMPSGPVELARRTGAAIVVGFVLRTTPGRYRIHLMSVPAPPRSGDREADVREGMRSLIATIEDGIRMAPDQWFALQPVWSGLAR
jgi:KDO2-lipid IV(A) lauroyltransferase